MSDQRRITEADLGPDGLTDEERQAGLEPLFGPPIIIDTAAAADMDPEGRELLRRMLQDDLDNGYLP